MLRDVCETFVDDDTPRRARDVAVAPTHVVATRENAAQCARELAGRQLAYYRSWHARFRAAVLAAPCEATRRRFLGGGSW